MGYGRIGHNITNPSRYRGNVFMSATVSAPPGSRRVDAFQDKAAVLAGLEACAIAFRTTNYIADHRGWRWGQGVTGFSMFNTILTPNDHQYQLGGCRFNGMPDWNMDNGFVFGASSNHPGGVNVLFADGERALRQGRDRSHGVVVTRDEGRGRGRLRRSILRPSVPRRRWSDHAWNAS